MSYATSSFPSAAGAGEPPRIEDSRHARSPAMLSNPSVTDVLVAD
jgi:hypothetical protein